MLIVLLGFFTTSSGHHFIPLNIDQRIEQHVSNHIRYMREEFGASCYGKGYGMFDDLANVSLDFQINRTVDLSEARRIFVVCHESLIIRFANDKEIRPYLHRFPVNKGFGCNLSFKAEKNENKIKNQVDKAWGGVNGVSYLTYFPERKAGDRFDDVHEEPYEESLRIVKEEMGDDFPKFNELEIRERRE